MTNDSAEQLHATGNFGRTLLATPREPQQRKNECRVFPFPLQEGVWVFDDAPAGLLEGGSSAGPSPNDSGGVAWKGLTEKMILNLKHSNL